MVSYNKSVESFFETYLKDKCKDKDNIDEVIQESIKLAYNDFKRTLQGIGSAPSENPYAKAEESIKEEIYKLKKQGIQSQENFDDWHKKACDKLLDLYNGRWKFCLGKAQKWINMTLKYLVAFKLGLNIKELGHYVELTPYFHVPIDNYILSEVKGIIPSDIIAGLKPWSKISDRALYDKFQSTFRKTFNGRIPLEVEFEMWNAHKDGVCISNLYVLESIRSVCENAPDAATICSILDKALQDYKDGKSTTEIMNFMDEAGRTL